MAVIDRWCWIERWQVDKPYRKLKDETHLCKSESNNATNAIKSYSAGPVGSWKSQDAYNQKNRGIRYTTHLTSSGDLAPSLGGRNIFSRTKISEWRFFGKFSSSTAKISDDLFSVIHQVFRIFHFFSQILRMFNVVWPFPHKNNHYFRKESLYDTFFSLFVLSRESDNTTSQNIGGTDAWAVPPPPIVWGEPSDPVPLGLRPCI